MRTTRFPAFLKSSLLAILAGLLTLTAVQPAAAQSEINAGETVLGMLDADNYSDLWTFEALAGDTVTINMIATSGDLDPYIDLWFQEDINMEKLAFDDDSGYNSNARIADFKLPYTGLYVIGAHRYDKADGDTSGAYRLSLGIIPFQLPTLALAAPPEQAIEINDVWEYSFLGGDCPLPGYCLPYDTFQWPAASLSYCLAEERGAWISDERHSFFLFGAVDLETSVAAALDYWREQTSFTFHARSCSSRPDIMIGFADPDDMQDLAPTADDGTRSYALNIGERSPQILILLNNRNVDWDAEGGYALDLAVAHEIGHALGISHDPEAGTLMHANLTTDDNLDTAALGADSQAQLFSLYPEAVTWETAKGGFIEAQSDVGLITSSAGESVSVTVPYPLGANSILPLCLPVGFQLNQQTAEDQPTGWRCTWTVDPIQRQVIFELTAYANTEMVSVRAILLDTDIFNLLHLYHFTSPPIDSGEEAAAAVYYDMLRFGEMVIPAFEYVVDDRAVPIVMVTEYASPAANGLTYNTSIDLTIPEIQVTSTGGGASSYVSGYIIVLQPTAASFAARCIMVEDPTCETVLLMPEWQTLSFGIQSNYDPNAVGHHDTIYLQIP